MAGLLLCSYYKQTLKTQIEIFSYDCYTFSILNLYMYYELHNMLDISILCEASSRGISRQHL